MHLLYFALSVVPKTRVILSANLIQHYMQPALYLICLKKMNKFAFFLVNCEIFLSSDWLS